MRFGLLAATLAALLGVAPPVSAAPPARKARRVVIRMEEVAIRGRIQKPQAMIILQRSGSFEVGGGLKTKKPVLSKKVVEDILEERK